MVHPRHIRRLPCQAKTDHARGGLGTTGHSHHGVTGGSLWRQRAVARNSKNGLPDMVNIEKTDGKITTFNRQINYQWAIFNSHVKLPEGTARESLQ